jgi:cyclophilin family peptidyl-prolyl cis-trans isomerase
MAQKKTATIKNESANGLSNKRGTLAMARTSAPDSASSQFFIVVKDAAFLDHQYTAFGEVTSGMDVADKIVAAPRDSRDNPTSPIHIKKVILAPLAGL